MRRREFIALLSGAAIAWPLAARAQSNDRGRRIGVLMSGAAGEPLGSSQATAFEQVLRTLGWRIGQNLQIEYRWPNHDPERVTAGATELVALAPDLIVANTTASLAALLAVTRAIPIVFVSVSDPVAQGFVANLAHPGGNATGFSQYEFSIAGKWLDLLKQFAPGLTHVGLMFNPATSPQGKLFLDAIESAAPVLGVDVTALPIHAPADIEPALAGLARRPNSGLIVGTDNFLMHNGEQIAVLAAGLRLPAIYGQREFVEAGGLMCYAAPPIDSFRGAAFYVDRILKGAKAGDLPVQLTNKFVLTINLKAVQALGQELPMGLMLSANEVIE
jgi:putative ABC transport system substrate-binding protein